MSEFEIVDRTALPSQGGRKPRRAWLDPVLAGEAVFVPTEKDRTFRARASARSGIVHLLGPDDTRKIHIIAEEKDGVSGLYIWLDGEKPE